MASPIADTFRLLYFDDSGSPHDGRIVYSWVEVTPQCWSSGLRHWLDLRRHLYETFGIPSNTELHASPLIGGRGHPSDNDAVNASKERRREVMMAALQAIGANTHIRIGTVYRVTSARGRAYAQQRDEVYRCLLAMLDERLAASGGYASVVMDGDGSDRSYFRAHRATRLSTRRIIEDPFFQASHVSQWVQMADLVAWSAYHSILRHPSREFAWGWYDTYVHCHDIYGGPLLV